jgi:hypothetical protein
VAFVQKHHLPERGSEQVECPLFLEQVNLFPNGGAEMKTKFRNSCCGRYELIGVVAVAMVGLYSSVYGAPGDRSTSAAKDNGDRLVAPEPVALFDATRYGGRESVGVFKLEGDEVPARKSAGNVIICHLGSA